MIEAKENRLIGAQPRPPSEFLCSIEGKGNNQRLFFPPVSSDPFFNTVY
jgi:hypothetical protein